MFFGKQLNHCGLFDWVSGALGELLVIIPRRLEDCQPRTISQSSALATHTHRRFESINVLTLKSVINIYSDINTISVKVQSIKNEQMTVNDQTGES